MSEMERVEGGEAPSGIPHYVVEAIVAVLMVAIGGVVVYSGAQLGAGWTPDGPGAGYFPFYIGVIICISGAVTLYKAVMDKPRNTAVFVEREQLRRILAVLVPAALFVLAIHFVGIYVAGAVYIALFMWVLGKFSPVKSTVTGFLVCAVFFALFEVWFKVPLFKGALDPLSFLGY